MSNWLKKDWVTTSLGLLAAILNLMANGSTPKNAALSVALAALGKASSDSK